jgi:serine/threonine protein kinase
VQIIKSTTIKFPDSVSELARDFVCAALVVDANKRASVTALLTHPWITLHAQRAPAAEAQSPTRQMSFTDVNSPQALQRRMGNDYDGADKVSVCGMPFVLQAVAVLSCSATRSVFQAVDVQCWAQALLVNV